jgi:hypothetical protein
MTFEKKKPLKTVLKKITKLGFLSRKMASSDKL